MEKEKESLKIQLNKITIISACTDGYARLTRLIGRLVKHQPYRNLTSRILTRSFAQNCNKPKWVKTHGCITYLVTSNKHVFAAYIVSFLVTMQLHALTCTAPASKLQGLCFIFNKQAVRFSLESD